MNLSVSRVWVISTKYRSYLLPSLSTLPTFLILPNLSQIPSRGYRENTDTHYTVLGVKPDASPREIKAAYLALSKKLHPDLNQGKDDKTSFEIHQKYVRVTQAYAVLGNKKDRKVYDMEVIMKQPPRWEESDEENTGKRQVFNERPMSFDERARAMGYKQQDPDFYKNHGNYHRKVVMYCIAWIVVGSIVTSISILTLYGRHTATMDAATRKNTEILNNSRERARRLGSLEAQRDEFEKKWAAEAERQEAMAMDQGIRINRQKPKEN